MRRRKLPSISQTLPPTDQAQTAKTLWLDLDRDVEILHDRVHAEGDAAQRPQEHHKRWKAFGVFRPVVAPYLRNELDAPKSVNP